MLDGIRLTWREEETRLLQHLRARRHRMRQHAVTDSGDPQADPRPDRRSPGDRVADAVAAAVGSWRFIIIQSCLLVLWMAINVIGWIQAWDPYPFILLNLVLSFQAAYTAPIIMMSQNRQAAIDRDAAKNDYDVNLKAELEIELLHQKVDLMREEEIARLSEVIRELRTELRAARGMPVEKSPAARQPG